MRTDRLLKLADLLEADAANPKGVKFDLRNWAAPATLPAKFCIWDDRTDEEAALMDEWTQSLPVNCGSFACAMGLAALSGVFADEGLTYKLGEKGDLYPVFGCYHGFEAADRFFELPEVDDEEGRLDLLSYWLFDPTHYQKTQGKEAELAVAKRIRLLVEKGTLDCTDVHNSDQ